MEDRFETLFNEQLKAWACHACSAWGFSDQSDAVVEGVTKRLPREVRAAIGLGLERGIVIADGHTFKLAGLDSMKGPYKWFSRYNSEGRPNPNWEYYVQVAEYIRLWEKLQGSDFRLNFEDGLMDIAVYDGFQLVLYVEVKEKAEQAENLLVKIRQHEGGVDETIPDRGVDSLRKAKYLLRHRPRYFRLVAIGLQRDFEVSFPMPGTFRLLPSPSPFS